ncbi:hypothetical protein ACFCX4_01000 [Kitasatospora sp. NPDC056327]|uniref:hypothetical protein n=1 Tax=Kitasatospora sp. NPDC056327 TaxID=3345785 RepID=UPI0035D9AB5D
MNRDGTSADTAVEGGGEVVRALAGLAETVETGPAPYGAVLAGGRRRVVRRRTSLVGALALGLVVAAGGVAVVDNGGGRWGGGGGGGAADMAAVAVSTADGATSLVPAAGGAVTPAPAGPRDPLAPTRIQVLAGVKDGRPWSVWAALWPAPGKERIHEQARAIWAENAAAGYPWPAPTEDYVNQYGEPDADHVVFYYVLDGTRLATPAEALVEPPGSPRRVPADGLDFSRVWLGAQSKNGEADPLFHVPRAQAGLVRPGVARAELTWADGVTAEPAILPLGDSEARWIAVAKRGIPADLRLYAADGALLATERNWLDS